MSDANDIGYRQVTFDELKCLIEQQHLYRDVLARRGDVAEKCHKYSRSYANVLDDQHIDHAILNSARHMLLAVKTTDRGIVIFDPTIRQFFPELQAPYFLDTPDKLFELIDHFHGDETLFKPMRMKLLIHQPPNPDLSEDENHERQYRAWEAALHCVDPVFGLQLIWAVEEKTGETYDPKKHNIQQILGLVPKHDPRSPYNFGR